jgi:response regulator RpfG family c-di-GMP phosphodiesterase
MDPFDSSLTAQGHERPATLLCVDDEPNILNALKRLFRPHGYRLLTADGGEQGLNLLAQTEVDLVISDMRMPEMDGARFLELVRQRWPGTLRILLTGYSDIASTIAAVNRGEIYRYISKPWLDEEVVLVVRQALELAGLAREKARLEALTRKQNLELIAFNAGLEDLVAQRTAALRKAMDSLAHAHAGLKKSFISSITVFSNLIELRHGAATGHSRRVADLARRLALRLKVGEAAQQDVLVAALLRDIGKLTLPDRVVGKAFSALSGEEQREFMKHPVKGQAALMALEQLAGAAHLIRGQHERWDGMGYPDGLCGSRIPQGARILAVASDYEGLQRGRVTNMCLTAAQAHAFIVGDRGKRYDPAVVDAFVETAGPASTQAVPVAEKHMTSPQLRSGMVLARDLLTRDGFLLLSRDHVLDSSLIEKIRGYEQIDANPIEVRVRVAADLLVRQ